MRRAGAISHKTRKRSFQPRLSQQETADTANRNDRIFMSISTIVKSIQDIMRQDAGVDGDAQRHFADGVDDVPQAV